MKIDIKQIQDVYNSQRLNEDANRRVVPINRAN
jgi:hypothetical protein